MKKYFKRSDIFYRENDGVRESQGSASHTQGMRRSCAQQAHFHLAVIDGDFWKEKKERDDSLYLSSVPTCNILQINSELKENPTGERI